MSTRFNLSSEMILSNRVDDNNEAYVEIILDIFEDSVAIHSIQGVTVPEDPELFSLINKASENKSSSSVRFSLLRKNYSHIKQGFQELKVRLASFTKRSSTSRRFDQTKSTAVHALRALKFIG